MRNMCALKVKRVAVALMGGEILQIAKLKCLAHKILRQFMTAKLKEHPNMKKDQDFTEIAQNEANERLQQEADNIHFKNSPLTPRQVQQKAEQQQQQQKFDSMRVLCVETVAGCFYWDLKEQLVDEDLHVTIKTSSRNSSELSTYVHS